MLHNAINNNDSHSLEPGKTTSDTEFHQDIHFVDTTFLNYAFIYMMEKTTRLLFTGTGSEQNHNLKRPHFN